MMCFLTTEFPMRFPAWLKVYGDLTYRGDCPSETMEQVTFFNTLRKLYPDLGLIALHPRNEGKKTMHQAMRERAEGLASGAPDVVIPGCPSLLIELKRRDHTKSQWQKGQEEYLCTAMKNGATVCVALGWAAAMEAVEHWLNASKLH